MDGHSNREGNLKDGMKVIIMIMGFISYILNTWDSEKLHLVKNPVNGTHDRLVN